MPDPYTTDLTECLIPPVAERVGAEALRPRWEFLVRHPRASGSALVSLRGLVGRDVPLGVGAEVVALGLVRGFGGCEVVRWWVSQVCFLRFCFCYSLSLSHYMSQSTHR